MIWSYSIVDIMRYNSWTWLGYDDMGYMDRLDYVSMVAGEHGFCMAIESRFIVYKPRLYCVVSKRGPGPHIMWGPGPLFVVQNDPILVPINDPILSPYWSHTYVYICKYTSIPHITYTVHTQYCQYRVKYGYPKWVILGPLFDPILTPFWAHIWPHIEPLLTTYICVHM